MLGAVMGVEPQIKSPYISVPLPLLFPLPPKLFDFKIMVLFNLKDKVALVTGGSAGLGAAIVERLAQEGCNVAINYSNSRDRAEALAKKIIETFGVKAVVLQGDVGSEQVCQELVDKTVELLGGLDVVISNAGYTRFVEFPNIEELSPDE
jgi:NAD(P)-dependent dehydrogenase (short-subunit alcohol dehydrogenase family)